MKGSRKTILLAGAALGSFATYLLLYLPISSMEVSRIASSCLENSRHDAAQPHWTKLLKEAVTNLNMEFTFANDSLAEWNEVRNFNFSIPIEISSNEPVTSVTQLAADLARGPLNSCGKAKCFISSKSNDSTGWLITSDAKVKLSPYTVRLRDRHDNPQPRSRWHSMVYAWTSAFEVEKTYGLPHFFLKDSPPILFAHVHSRELEHLHQTIDQLLAPINAENDTSETEEEWRGTIDRIKRSVGTRNEALVVQRVVKAPSTIQVIKRRRSRSQFTQLIFWPRYYIDGPFKTPSFYTSLFSGLCALRDMLRTYPALWHDFQFAVDAQTGQVYRLDLDRQLEFFHRFPMGRDLYQAYRDEIEEQVHCWFNRYWAEITYEVQRNDMYSTMDLLHLPVQGPDPDNCFVEENTFALKIFTKK